MSEIRKVEFGTLVPSPDAIERLERGPDDQRRQQQREQRRNPREVHDTVEITGAVPSGPDGASAYDVPRQGSRPSTGEPGGDDQSHPHIDIAV